MIRIGEKTSTRMDTGKHVDSAAETFSESGPRDDLRTIDAYGDGVEAGSPFNPAGEAVGFGGGDTNGVGGLKSFFSVKDGVSATTPSSGGGVGQVTNTLWQSLICGLLDPVNLNLPNLGKMRDISLHLRSTNCGIPALLKLLKRDTSGFSLNKEELSRRLHAAVGHSMLNLTNSDPDTFIEKAISTHTGEDSGMVSVMGGVKNYLDGKKVNVSTLKGLIQAVPGASDAIEVLDLEAESLFLGGFLQELSDLGIPEASKMLLDQIQDSEVKKRVIIDSLEYHARSTQLGLVNYTIDEIGAHRALAKVPNLIEIIIENYKMSRLTKRTEYPAKYAELISTLTKIHSNWDKTKRNGLWVSSLKPFQRASSMAKVLFKSSPYKHHVMMAHTYPERNIWLVVRKYNPRTIRVT